MNYSDFDLSGKRIIVTGGSGFIGHNLVLKLREAGAEVCVLDNLSHNNIGFFWGNSGNLPVFKQEVYLQFLQSRLMLLKESGCQFHNVDSRRKEDLERAFEIFQPSVVFHLAAESNAARANKDPHTTFDNSVITLENALECARTATTKVEHFIYLSSSMAYGDFPPDGVTEETPLRPKGIYGSYKAAAELMVRAYTQVYGMPHSIIRPSALYGPRCVSRRVTSIFVENAIEGNPIYIEGDGDEKLDFTYIDDLVQGLFRIVVSEKAKNETFNLTFGDHRSINDLVEVIAEYFPELDVQHKERDNLRPYRGTLIVDKAKELIDYSPEFSIEKGMPAYIRWYQSVMDKVPG